MHTAKTQHPCRSAGGILLLVVLVLVAGCGRKLVPLSSAKHGADEGSALPANTIVLDAAGATGVTSPFSLSDEASAADGVALVLPEGACTATRTGHATLPVIVKSPGTYEVWAHVRWSDSCGNSLALRIGDTPQRIIGQDQVYGTWHWVKAGKVQLAAGTHSLVVSEYEDGTALDQILLTPDEDFLPMGPVSRDREAVGIRQFADDFSRSPGHGMEAWDLSSPEQWMISFSFDPNRIPNQYALTGEAKGHTATAVVKGPPWRGARIRFSFNPVQPGRYGVVMDRGADGRGEMRVGFEVTDGKATLIAPGGSAAGALDLRLNNWHRVQIDRWAWVLRVRLDGRTVLEDRRLKPRPGRIGFFVEKGAAVFDDLSIGEIPWQADDGREFRMPWTIAQGAAWFRPVDPRAAEALVGRRGTVSVPGTGLTVEEVLLEEEPDALGACAVECAGLGAGRTDGSARWLQLQWPALGSQALSLSAGKREVALRRIAVAYGQPMQDCYRIGPYHFTKPVIEDPSDYLDFTPEEYQKMTDSGEYDKLRRSRKFNRIVGRDKSPWVPLGGRWVVTDGLLRGTGPSAELRHSLEILSDFELRLRFRLTTKDSAFRVQLYGGPERDPTIEVAQPGHEAPDAPKPLKAIVAPADDAWHHLSLRTRGGTLTVDLDRGPGVALVIDRGDGGRVTLGVPAGTVEFDDIDFLIVRRTSDGALSAFDRRETDWWREGAAWIDHGGISCELASSWISLVAPKGSGMLWYKRDLGPDVEVAFNVQENSEWYGWHARPDHTHFPFDNIRVMLSPDSGAKSTLAADLSKGYRLEINTANRTQTVLYRNGRPVVTVPQTRGFPIRYHGGHAPYSPRINRISLVKRGPLIRALINGRQVILYDDKHPIDVKGIGIGGYDTRFNLAQVEVRRLPAWRPHPEP